MKNLFILFLYLTGLTLFSQTSFFERERPLVVENKAMKFNELSKAIEKSFIDRDIQAKGSGWKVYQRWKYISNFEVNEDGYLPDSWDFNQSITAFKNTKRFTEQAFARAMNSQWAPVGPFTYSNKGSWSTGQGRVNCMITDPNNEDIIYVGAATGGVWKSTNGGATWTPMTDFIDSLGISGITIDPNNSNIVYAMTGDADGSNIGFNGLYKSTDAGLTWTKLGLSGISYGRNILINPTDSKVITVATNSGVFRSTNAGTTFVKVLSGLCYQVAFNTKNDAILYASISNGTDSSIYKSTDNGVNWSLKKTLTATRKTILATTLADSDYLYLLGANSSGSLNGFKGVFLSTDGGENFTEKNNTTNILESGQSYYDLALAVSQVDKNVVYTGCLNIWKSTDEGTTFTKQNSWSSPTGVRYTHADIHQIKTVGSNVYVGSDGGIYVSKDNGASFQNKTSGLQISQFYKIDTAPQTNTTLVGGLQDNGGFAAKNDSWVNFYGADGMDVAIDPKYPNRAYGMIQYGNNLYRYDFNTASNGQPVASHANGNWVTPLEISSASNIYGGWQEIEEIKNGAWQPVTAIANGNFISNMKVNPLMPNRVLFSRPDISNSSVDELLYTNENRDADGNLEAVALTLPVVSSSRKSISGFCFHPTNPDVFYIIYNSSIYKTSNSGQSWTDITYDFPTVSKFCIAAQGNDIQSLYVGTSYGVYYFDEQKKAWELFSNSLPKVRVTELKVNTYENNLTAATYGRGVWRIGLPTSTLKTVTSVEKNNQISITPNPSHGIFMLDVDIDEPLQMIIYDLNGKTVLNKNFDKWQSQNEIDLSNQPKGMYLLDVKSDRYVIRKKILIY